MRLELTKGKRTNWIDLQVDNKKLVTSSGATGVAMKTATKTYGTPAKAKAAYEAALAAKLAEGYRDPNNHGEAPADTPREPALEAAIRANREDAGAYQVYADWLQEHGSPLGELIVLQQGNKQARAAKIIDRLALPGRNFATFIWRHGFWQWLRIENGADWMNNEFDPVALARRLFAQPVCAVLEELRLGVLRWDHNHVDVPAVLAEAKKHAWAADLATLHLGDIEEIDTAHHAVGDVGKAITKAFPRLHRLTVHSGEQGWRAKGKETFGLAGLDLPELRELTIETCSLSKKRLAGVLAAKLPNLEKLVLWFGSARYGCDASVRQLTKLLDGSAFPKLRHLGLCNAEFQNEIAAAVATSPIAGQLESLDLSMGTMTDAGLDVLTSCAKRFGKLKALKLDENFLTAQGIKPVKAKFPFLTAKDQKEADNSIEGETHYYVSLAE